jgi:Uma2 family endonuclease
VNAPALRMTHAEYCAFEREAAVKHEYVAGEVFAMAGGSLEHGRLAGKLAQLLSNQLEGRPCRVLSADARVRIEAADADVYPDLSVICGPPRTAEADDHALLNPTLVVEILSNSTEGYDRGLKASYYRRIPSLQAYLLVAQGRPQLELQVRDAEDRWMIIEAGPGQRLSIAPLGVELEVDALYRDALQSSPANSDATR